MILQNCGIIASILFLVLSKIVCVIVERYRSVMFNKSGSVLTSIPENDEDEIRKWVPKKKHEVLKAKYKCLKKLFQIYDASVIGILPEGNEEYEETTVKSHRRKRSHRTKSDACAGTTEASSGDVSVGSDMDKASTIATAVMRELKMPKYSCTSTQFEATSASNVKYDRYTTAETSKTNLTEQDYKEELQPPEPNHLNHPIPYLMVNEKPKLTRFQSFIQRLLGIKQERQYKNYVHNGHVYAASDINTPHYEKRRRRGLKFRRLRKLKKIQSESALRNVKSPMILTYVQSVQKNCLMDTTPRQCPIMGCRMIFYGIINYNDHLNLCHFIERKYVCHYCHEGFVREYDKYLHENEHIGINKLNTNIPTFVSTSSSEARKASNTQTDPELTKTDLPEEKLKKIVSFFDKISNPDQILSEMKKNRYSETNLQTLQRSDDIESVTTNHSDSDKRTVSCMNLDRKKVSAAESDATMKSSPVPCNLCGEQFDNRRQLSLHVDIEHRGHEKYSKFHSCAGITSRRRNVATEDGKIDFKSIDKTKVDRRKSDESLNYEPATNIVYYTSMESVKSKVPVDYKWEPGTKIIRV